MALNQLERKEAEAVIVSKVIPGLVSGYLEDFCQADIIVNSAPKSMQLSQSGNVSASILRRAGDAIQNECNEKFPNGIQDGEIAITSAYKLPYSLVFHCTVQDMTMENSFTKMAQLIKKCLKEADGRQITKTDRRITLTETIAFPLLGTGPKNFSPEICCIFYRTILAFCLGPTKSLKNAYIIVLPKDKHLISVIENLNAFDEFQKITHEMSYPYKWLETQNCFDLVNLDQASEEYETVRENFLLHGPLNPTILKIERIQNKNLYKIYLQTRCKRKMTNKSDEKELWISCQSNQANELMINGLNKINKSSTNYGEGYQFFAESNVADESIEQAPGQRTAFLCSVGIRKIIQGKREYNKMSIPQKNLTAVNSIHAPSIYVIFDRCLFYPNYIVTYQTVS